VVVHGALAGAFSPISVYGAFINSYLAEAGLPTSPLALFFCGKRIAVAGESESF
jgi:hypothetical protein